MRKNGLILQIFYDYKNKIKSILSNKEDKNNNSLNNINVKLIKKIIARVSESNKPAASKEIKSVLIKLLKGFGI